MIPEASTTLSPFSLQLRWDKRTRNKTYPIQCTNKSDKSYMSLRNRKSVRCITSIHLNIKILINVH